MIQRRLQTQDSPIRPDVHARFLSAMKRADNQHVNGLEDLRPLARAKSRSGWRKTNAIALNRNKRRAS